jgi:hypothetical protein
MNKAKAVKKTFEGKLEEGVEFDRD